MYEWHVLFIFSFSPLVNKFSTYYKQIRVWFGPSWHLWRRGQDGIHDTEYVDLYGYWMDDLAARDSVVIMRFVSQIVSSQPVVVPPRSVLWDSCALCPKWLCACHQWVTDRWSGHARPQRRICYRRLLHLALGIRQRFNVCNNTTVVWFRPNSNFSCQRYYAWSTTFSYSIPQDYSTGAVEFIAYIEDVSAVFNRHEVRWDLALGTRERFDVCNNTIVVWFRPNSNFSCQRYYVWSPMNW